MKILAKIRVIVVDDSRLMREVLRDALSRDPDIDVVGLAASAIEAQGMINELRPDVLTLDVEMPGMNGLEFLKKLMKWRPIPVVMVSGATSQGADLTFRALEAGAFDFIAKPGRSNDRARFSEHLKCQVRAAAKNGIPTVAGRQGGPRKAKPLSDGRSPDISRSARAKPTARMPSARGGTLGSPPFRGPRIIAIGASTGGVTSIERVLEQVVSPFPPIVIAQHMPREFTKRFASRLAALTGLDIAEARNEEALQPGNVRLVPGDGHLSVNSMSGQIVCRLEPDDPPSRVRPSVDRLFHSVATQIGGRSIGIILSGMGRDGAGGLLAMRRAGAFTLGEAESSCTVYGMPKAAWNLGAVEEEADISGIADLLTKAVNKPARARSS